MGKMQTANVLPNGDVLKGWFSTGSNHYDQIDEITPITSDYIYSGYFTSGYDRFIMQNAGQGPSVFTKITVKIYCKETVANLRIYVQAYIYGSPIGGKHINCPSAPGWKTVTWDLEYNKSAMDTLEIQVSGSIPDKMGVIYIYSLYAELTYSTPWGPDEWSDPSVSRIGDYAYTYQTFKWYQDSLDLLKAKGGSYIYEVRRNIDVWDFVQLNSYCGNCFVEFTTNLPDIFGPTIFQESEADFWLRFCCWLIDSDEESELRVYDVSNLQAGTQYYVHFKFVRRQENQSFTLWTESERCNFIGGNFEWYRMTQSTEQS